MAAEVGAKKEAGPFLAFREENPGKGEWLAGGGMNELSCKQAAAHVDG